MLISFSPPEPVCNLKEEITLSEKKGQVTDLGANTSRQTSSSTRGGASDRTLTEKEDGRKAQESEKEEGQGIGRGFSEEERPREI